MDSGPRSPIINSIGLEMSTNCEVVMAIRHFISSKYSSALNVFCYSTLAIDFGLLPDQTISVGRSAIG